MSDFLLLNIGNTHTQSVLADHAGNFLTPVTVISTDQWMNDCNLLPDAAGDCRVWASCVVPQARELLTSARKYQHLDWVSAEKARCCGLDFSPVDTSTLGADRIANAAAMLAYPLPAVNFDCGTAVTMETVNAEQKFIGGAIMPGRRLMRHSLASGTAALPDIPLTGELPTQLGVNTVQAITLGIDRGIIGMVKEFIMMNRNCGITTFLASGGDADFFCRAIPELQAAGDEFTLRGIWQIAVKHA